LRSAIAVASSKKSSRSNGSTRFLEAWIAYREIQKLVPQVMKKYEVKIPHTDLDGDIVPVEIKALVEEPTPAILVIAVTGYAVAAVSGRLSSALAQ
jgi:hypothetical protein